MGRYFQHTLFPGAPFAIPGVATLLPQSRVDFHSSGGVHLITWALDYVNGTGALAAVTVSIFLDGVDQGLLRLAVNNVPIGLTTTLTKSGILEIPPGPHTLEIFILGMAGAGDTINPGSAHIFAIEFPSWESADRIEN